MTEKYLWRGLTQLLATYAYYDALTEAPANIHGATRHPYCEQNVDGEWEERQYIITDPDLDGPRE